MNRFIYHYCAIYQGAGLGNTVYIDGIALRKKRITCHADHLEFKKKIDEPNSHKMTITSLSYLGREDD